MLESSDEKRHEVSVTPEVQEQINASILDEEFNNLLNKNNSSGIYTINTDREKYISILDLSMSLEQVQGVIEKLLSSTFISTNEKFHILDGAAYKIKQSIWLGYPRQSSMDFCIEKIAHLSNIEANSIINR